MTYVNATLTLIKSTPVVTLMARGHRIKQAVDVALTIVKRMSAVGYTIGDVRISSNPMESLDGKSRNISTIEIDIQKSDS
ncbi:MAG: DNA-binding protein [Nitrosopumilaceae archaeon]|nr:DNA-binding protein [Nitrosopumilaceae archaeon]